MVIGVVENNPIKNPKVDQIEELQPYFPTNIPCKRQNNRPKMKYIVMYLKSQSKTLFNMKIVNIVLL